MEGEDRGLERPTPAGAAPSRGRVLHVREPRWTRGAYSQPPHLVDEGPGRTTAAASIESWRGTPEELLAVVRSLEGAAPGAQAIAASLTWSDGRSERATSLDDVTELVLGLRDDRAAILRVEVDGDGARGAVLVASRFEPGLAVEILDSDAGRALGNAELAFRRMMVGYVDRMGGVRGLAWMLAAIAPLMLVGIALAPGSASGWARALVLLLGVLSSVVSFVYFRGRILYPHALGVVAHVSAGTPVETARPRPPAPGSRHTRRPAPRCGGSGQRLVRDRSTR